MNVKEIELQARKELDEELFREQVEKHKEYLKSKKTIWDTLFPYRIIIIKKEKKNGRH